MDYSKLDDVEAEMREKKKMVRDTYHMVKNYWHGLVYYLHNT